MFPTWKTRLVGAIHHVLSSYYRFQYYQNANNMDHHSADDVNSNTGVDDDDDVVADYANGLDGIVAMMNVRNILRVDRVTVNMVAVNVVVVVLVVTVNGNMDVDGNVDTDVLYQHHHYMDADRENRVDADAVLVDHNILDMVDAVAVVVVHDDDDNVVLVLVFDDDTVHNNNHHVLLPFHDHSRVDVLALRVDHIEYHPHDASSRSEYRNSSCCCCCHSNNSRYNGADDCVHPLLVVYYWRYDPPCNGCSTDYCNNHVHYSNRSSSRTVMVIMISLHRQDDDGSVHH